MKRLLVGSVVTPTIKANRSTASPTKNTNGIRIALTLVMNWIFVASTKKETEFSVVPTMKAKCVPLA